ncbi:hypothetical protein [Streptomyces sp. NPDC029674]|uniref:hypothetical protein n=1 Tax=Streptomyces sp. NPDC029674 TaxID=3365297 RepID=UPI00384D95D3
MTVADVSVSGHPPKSRTTAAAAAAVPAPFGAATAERLDRLDREATQHVEDHRPDKTKQGYRADWNAWLRFCAEQDLPPAAVRTGTLVAFVEWCWRQPGQRRGTLLAPTTIDRRISGVVVTGRRQLKLQLAEDIAEEARALLKAKIKQMEKDGESRGNGPAAALLVRHMEKVAAALPPTRFGIRDLSLMTLDFAVAGREHELAWLRVRDITEDPEGRGLLVDIRVSKNKPRKVAVPFGSRAHLCPVRT